MTVGELSERLKVAPKNLKIFLENGRAVSDVELTKHPHLDSNDDVIRICSEG